MSQSTTRTRTKPAAIKAVPRASIQAQQAAVEKVLRPASQKSSESLWVSALLDAGAFHRDALQLELAVGLSLFAAKADANKVPLEAKKILREVYAQAGYACKTPVGEDYKTVARRIGVAADLYTFIGGRETVTDWAADALPTQQIQAIMEHLKTYNFSGINSVLSYIGKPVQVKRPRDPEVTAKTSQMSEEDKLVAEAAAQALSVRKAAEASGIPEGRVFSRGAITVAVPFNATYDDVVALAMDLMTFAKTQMPLPVSPALVAAH